MEKKILESIQYANCVLMLAIILFPTLFIYLLYNYTIYKAAFLTLPLFLSCVFFWFENYTYIPKEKNIHYKICDKLNTFIMNKFNISFTYLPDFYRTINVCIICLFMIIECKMCIYIMLAISIFLGNILHIVYKYISLTDINRRIKTLQERRK